MKRLALFTTVGSIILSTTLAFAASTTQPTPVTHPAISSMNKPATAADPGVHQINLRLRTQWSLIQKELHANKITPQQAITLRASLKAVRQQEVGFFKQNGSHTLTTAQLSQLNQALNANSSTLGETSVN